MLLFAIASLLGLPMAAMTYALWRAFRPPRNSPAAYRRSSAGAAAARPVVVFAGDSLTHGHVSHDWVAELGRRIPDMVPVNAGINGDLSENLVRRLDVLLDCRPVASVVLIGTNDILGTLSPGLAKQQARAKTVRAPRSLATYADHLRQIVLRLGARGPVFLVTLPPLGEDLTTAAHALVVQYNGVIAQVARDAQTASPELGPIHVIPFHQALLGLLAGKSTPPRPGFAPGARELWWMIKSPVWHYVLGRRWDAIAASNGLALSPDLIHLGERAGMVLVDLLAPALRDQESRLPPG
jgi:lysophospholipase L1-like esterase